MPTPDEAFVAYSQSLNSNAGLDQIHRAFFMAGWKARDTLLAESAERHLVDVTPEGWTMQHPLRERESGSLLDCSFNELVRTACEENHLTEGRFEVWVEDGTRVLRWEEA